MLKWFYLFSTIPLAKLSFRSSSQLRHWWNTYRRRTIKPKKSLISKREGSFTPNFRTGIFPIQRIGNDVDCDLGSAIGIIPACEKENFSGIKYPSCGRQEVRPINALRYEIRACARIGLCHLFGCCRSYSRCHRQPRRIRVARHCMPWRCACMHISLSHGILHISTMLELEINEYLILPLSCS